MTILGLLSQLINEKNANKNLTFINHVAQTNYQNANYKGSSDKWVNNCLKKKFYKKFGR